MLSFRRIRPRLAASCGAALGLAGALVLSLGGCAHAPRTPVVSPTEVDPPRRPAPRPAEPVAGPDEAVESTLATGSRYPTELLHTDPAVPEELGEIAALPEPAPPTEPAPGEQLSAAEHDELAVPVPLLTEEQVERERALVTNADVPAEAAGPVHASPTFDIPIVHNDRVMTWVHHYAARGERFQVGLERSGRYLGMFRRIFAEAGLPQDLVYMAHVESAYKTTAYSRAKAKGIFQFIYGTARRYGLRVDYWVDERSDPEKSARAAAAYLTDLYDEFGDWYLALAAYNAGEGRIRSAIRRSGTRDFWKIARTRYIRRETKNYVPAILAATLISKEPHKYGFDVEYAPPIEYESVQVRGPADLRVLAECAGADYETLRALNPALRRQQTPPDGTTDVRVPVGRGQTMLAALAEIPVGKRVLYARHYVRRGDTLSTIARAYGVSVRSIQQANGMGRRTMIRAGKTLQIPTSAGARYPSARTGAMADAAGEYRVRRGDTLWAIAARHGTTPRALAALNGMRVDQVLHVGDRLRVRAGGGSSVRAHASSASAGPRAFPYRVRRGDNLWRIARRNGTTPAAIAAASGISVNKTLRIGEILTVVSGVRSATAARRIARSDAAPRGQVVHTVRRGESLWRIAARYRTSVDRLCSLNNISRHATLYPGTRLTIAVE